MKYILRVVIHENDWERQLEDIVMICKYADIEEVFCKEQCHQILMSCFKLDKHRRMADIYIKIAKRLKAENITFSINLATIVGHCDADLKEDMILPYVKFVGESLKPNVSTYCILDPEWQAYAKEVVRIYAETNPQTIMIDDDFRSINHSGYLGCFCENHIHQTSVKCGFALKSESLRNHIVGNSELDVKVRKAWCEANFEGQLQAARKMESSIHQVNPEIKVGLMNSGEENHSVQGRDIGQLIQAFAGKTGAVSRPLGGAYRDCLHQELVHGIEHGTIRCGRDYQ